MSMQRRFALCSIVLMGLLLAAPASAEVRISPAAAVR